MRPKFSTLIFLTFVSVLLLLPFVFSSQYLPVLRDESFEIHLFLQGEIYKQVTGYVSLALVLFEMLLSFRKRGRSWKVKIRIPGSIIFWRSLHIFLGVGLLGTTLVHTTGANGANFNGIFLWVFFGVTLSALVGVVAETGILESPRRYFGWVPAQPTQFKAIEKEIETGAATATEARKKGKIRTFLSKGSLIRGLRSLWLSTHILLVTIFFVMLLFHIFLAYYYQ